MIITIQPLKKGYEIVVGNEYIFSYPGLSQFEIIEHATGIAETILEERGVRPMIKWLPIIHTSMEKTYYALYTKRGNLSVFCEKLPIYWIKAVAVEQSKFFNAIVKKVSVTVNPVEDVTNYNQPMAMTKGTYPAKKQAVAKKAKKVVKKAGKK